MGLCRGYNRGGYTGIMIGIMIGAGGLGCRISELRGQV